MNISKKWISLFLAGLMVVAMMPATVMAEENSEMPMRGNGHMSGADVPPMDGEGPMMDENIAIDGLPMDGEGPMKGERMAAEDCEELDFDTAQERILEAIDNHIVRIEESEDMDEDEKEELIGLLEETRESVEGAEDLEELKDIMNEMADELREMGYRPFWNFAKNHPHLAWECVDFEDAQEHVLNFVDRAIERFSNAENLDEEIVEEYTEKLEEIKDNIEEAEDKEELREAMEEMRELLKDLREDIKDSIDEE